MIRSISQEASNALGKKELSEKIVTDVFELGVLRSDFLLHQEERPKAQWFLRYKSLGDTIVKAENEKEWAFVLKNIRQTYDSLGSSFSELVKYKEGAVESKELEERLVGNLLIKSQEIVSIVEDLNKLANTKLTYALQFSSIVYLLIIFIDIFLIINFIFVFNSILKPIIQLHKATEELEKGNYSVRTNIKTKDELEQLGKSFNKTAEVLGNLENEHKQIDKSKTEFLSISSHELRSPMTPMMAQLQMLLGDYFGKLNQKQKESIDIVLRNTKRLDGIIQDFLEISRIEAARLKFIFVKTDLSQNINSLVKEMQGFLPEKNITIKKEIKILPIIEVDPDRTMQVLRNLINNAKKFSPNDTTITIYAERKGNFIEFSVSDEGIGISKEKQQRIFEPFYRAEETMYRRYGGTGLGLAICKGIVESQNGKIWFESKKGRGTIFHFTIPLNPVREIKPLKLIGREEVVTGREEKATGREEKVKNERRRKMHER